MLLNTKGATEHLNDASEYPNDASEYPNDASEDRKDDLCCNSDAGIPHVVIVPGVYKVPYSTPQVYQVYGCG